MPSDTYILTISEAGVSVPSTHGSTHISGGSDVIPTATSSASGLMSAAIFNQHVTNTAKVSNATHTGDVTDASGVLTVKKINGVLMESLATGIVKNTTSTGAPSIAIAADFPTLNQSTTGNANTATTSTNIAGGAIGTIPYQSAANTTAMLAAGTSGQVLKSNGSAAPSWGSLSIATDITGTMPVEKGGTGVVILSGIVKANGTNPFTAVTAPAGDIVGTTATQTLTNKTLGSGTTVTDLGTPNSGTLTNCTDLPISGLVSSTSTALGVGSIELGHATDTTISRVSAGRIAVEGVNVVTTSSTDTLSNKTLVAPALGTPIFGTLTNCIGLPIGSGTTGTLPVNRGGTGVTTLASGFIKSDGTILTSSAAPISIADGGTGVTQSAYGECYISSVTATTIATTGTFVKVAGTTTAGTLSNFTHPNNNRLTYTGTATRKFLITTALSFHGTSTNDYKFAFHKNTSSLLSPSIISSTGAGTGDLAHISCQTIVELATNDFIEVFVTNADATNSATIDFMNMVAVAII